MKKLTMFVILILIVLITLWDESYADRPSGGGGGQSYTPYVPMPNPVFVPKPFIKISANEVYQHLLKVGLADDSKPEVSNDNKIYKIVFTSILSLLQ